MNSLLELLVALCGAELVHNSYEMWGVRHKLNWLGLTMDSKEHDKWPLHIDTRLKVIILHAILLVLSTSLFFFALQALDLSDESLVVLGILVILSNYIYTTWRVDKYHCDIGILITKAKK